MSDPRVILKVQEKRERQIGTPPLNPSHGKGRGERSKIGKGEPSHLANNPLPLQFRTGDNVIKTL